MSDGVLNRLLVQVRGQLEQLSSTQLTTLRALIEPASMRASCLALIEQRGQAQRQCPHCAAGRIYRHGFASGLQRYRCLDCGRTFNALTGVKNRAVAKSCLLTVQLLHQAHYCQRVF